MTRIPLDLAGVSLVPEHHGVIAGPPAKLKAICAWLGFRNDCRRGRVYLTDAKLRRLGLLDSSANPAVAS